MQEAEIGWIAAIIVGGFAGWFAEMFMKSGTGIFSNIILGIVGAALGNWLLKLLGISLGGWTGYLHRRLRRRVRDHRFVASDKGTDRSSGDRDFHLQFAAVRIAAVVPSRE